MKIDAIHRGIVLDHIKAGRAMDIYRYLHLDELQCPVAIIKNARSEAMGLKDIIKIDDEIDIDLDVVGFVDPGTTVNIIKDGVVFHELYRGTAAPGEFFGKISDTLMLLSAGGEAV